MPAARSQVLGVVAQMQERVQRRIRDYPNIATASAIAARWTTTRYEFFPPKSRDAITASAALYSNLRAINKHLKRKRRRPKFFSTWLRRRMIARSLQVLGRRSLFQRVDANELAAAPFLFKLHDAVNQRKQSVVLAASDIFAGLPFGATLSRNNVSTQYTLATKLLQTQTLRIGIAAITR